MESLTTHILDQLARSTLLSGDMSAAILAGDPPRIEDVVTTLVHGSIDCEAMTRNDPQSSWNDRRIARQVLTIAFLSALLQVREA